MVRLVILDSNLSWVLDSFNDSVDEGFSVSMPTHILYTDIRMCSVSPTHHATPPNVAPLLNSVIDVCLVYGIDETSARELPVMSEEGVRE